jgi:RNA binding exosome subunit
MRANHKAQERHKKLSQQLKPGKAVCELKRKIKVLTQKLKRKDNAVKDLKKLKAQAFGDEIGSARKKVDRKARYLRDKSKKLKGNALLSNEEVVHMKLQLED